MKMFRGSEDMQIVICDDEKEIRNMLADRVKKVYPQAKIIVMMFYLILRIKIPKY